MSDVCTSEFSASAPVARRSPSTEAVSAAPGVATRPALWRAVGQRAAHGLGLVPASLGELAFVLAGQPSRAAEGARRHAGVRGHGPVPAGRAATHAVLGVLLGAFFWWLAWMAAVATARGPFYGVVVPGPYDDAWGGPGLVGAWAAHAWVWVAAVAVLAALWWALVGLHRRVTEHLVGERRRVWTVPLSVVVALGAALLVVAWVRQI
jgi:hypothetical protein